MTIKLTATSTDHVGSLRLAAGQTHAITQPAAVATWMRLARVYQKLDRAIAESLRRYGLSVSRFDVLAQVGAREGLTQQELADVLLVTKGNIPQVLDPLEAEGLIERHRCGRSKHIHLTPRGRELRDCVVAANEAFIAGLFTSLSAEEQAALRRLLRTLDRGLDARLNPDDSPAAPG